MSRENKMVSMKFDCKQCKKHFYLWAYPEDFLKWKNGVLIGNAMPYLTIDECTLISTKVCAECIRIHGYSIVGVEER